MVRKKGSGKGFPFCDTPQKKIDRTHRRFAWNEFREKYGMLLSKKGISPEQIIVLFNEIYDSVKQPKKLPGLVRKYFPGSSVKLSTLITRANSQKTKDA